MSEAAERPGLIPVREAARRYGVTKKTVYKWIKAGAVPYVRVGPWRTIRVDVEAADRVLRRPG